MKHFFNEWLIGLVLVSLIIVICRSTFDFSILGSKANLKIGRSCIRNSNSDKK